MIEPVLEEIARENEGRLRIGKVNADDNLETVRRFDVMSIPTLILFKDGEPQLRLVAPRVKRSSPRTQPLPLDLCGWSLGLRTSS